MTNFQPWSQKYRPKETNQIIGQPEAVETVLSYINNFSKGKAVILNGPPGTGKTSIVRAAAEELGMEFIEMNASDFRTAAGIKEKIGHAASQQTLLQKKGKVIMVDEVDGLHGNSDRGGLPEIMRIIETSAYPIVLTANDISNQKFKKLKKTCKVIQLDKIELRGIVNKLKQVAMQEKLKIDEDILNELARRADGDLRVAINDFQSLAQGNESITKDDLKLIVLRDKRMEIMDTLKTIFKSTDRKAIQKALWDSNKTPDEIMLWITENIEKEYEKPEEVAKAFDRLSRADIHKGRIIKNQTWGLLKYSSDMMGLGVSSAKKEKYEKSVKYSMPMFLIKMGRTKIKRAIRDSTATVVGETCHCSKKHAVKQFPYLSQIAKRKNLDFEFEPEQLNYLKEFV